MMEVANIFALVQDGAQGIFSGISDYLAQLGLGTGELSAGSAAVGLAVVWIFVRVIRTVVSVLFALCVLLLVLQLMGYVDTSAIWETVQGWLGSAGAEAR